MFNINEKKAILKNVVKHTKNLNSLTVFPNPSTDVIQIIANEGHSPSSYSIYSISGKLIKKGNFSTHQNSLNISDLTPGNYLLQLKGNNTEETHQIIKK